MFISALLNALMLASLLAFSHGLLKWVAIQKVDGYFDLLAQYWWIICVAIGIYVFIFFYYAYVLRFVQISTFYPIYTGLSIILVFLIGIGWFGETMRWPQAIGCLLIISGIFMVSGKL